MSQLASISKLSILALLVVMSLAVIFYREGRKLKPQTLMAMVQNLLYERRFGPYFVEPVIAGLNPTTKEPYICALDLIGCATEPADFVVSGTCSESLYGEFRILMNFYPIFISYILVSFVFWWTVTPFLFHIYFILPAVGFFCSFLMVRASLILIFCFHYFRISGLQIVKVRVEAGSTVLTKFPFTRNVWDYLAWGHGAWWLVWVHKSVSRQCLWPRCPVWLGGCCSCSVSSFYSRYIFIYEIIYILIFWERGGLKARICLTAFICDIKRKYERSKFVILVFQY